jgi:NAD(P)-dependent dehydrogenase (short-subunit alcohol dehydrogenase family)
VSGRDNFIRMSEQNKTGSRVAVITGAAQGIGRRTAELLAERGYRLGLLDLKPCSETIAAIPKAASIDFTGDVTDESFIKASAAAIEERWGAPDVVINNAGISFIKKSEETTVADYRHVLEVNLVAPFIIVRAFAPMMLARKQGSFVNVASIAGLFGVSERTAYNASKHGLVGMTRTLAAEWGGRGVRSNAVCPGWVKTPMDDVEQARGVYSDEDIANRIPMGRFASPDDVAKAIAFLADPEQSGFVNGHTLVVDGGWTADASWESLRLSQRKK